VATPSYDRDFWEQLWSRTLRERGDDVARRPPNAHLTAEVGSLRPGLALDAGSVEEMVRRMGSGVASGGTLLLVGHRPVDPVTGAAAPAAGQVQVGLLCEPATVLLIMGVTGEQRN
jgi:hypothetical protein